jgi:hypothetical protein
MRAGGKPRRNENGMIRAAYAALSYTKPTGNPLATASKDDSIER